METIATIFAYLKVPAVAGFIGGIVSFKFINIPTWSKRVGAALIGSTLAHFATPVVAYYFEMHDKYEPSVGFLIGLFGMSSVAAMLQILPEVIKNRLGGRSQ